MKAIKIGKRQVGPGHPCYVIAEVGSNFDRSIERAKMLIDLAKECGANAVKFQCFSADRIVSREGFEGLQTAFQSKWKKPVYEVYKDAEFPRNWHEELNRYALNKGLDFLSAPYDMEAADILENLKVPVYKIGSGDITWHEFLRYVAAKGKPMILGTGASTIAEIDEAVRVIRDAGNTDLALLQCVTNYPSHYEYANIRAMKAMGETFDVPVGYSDHTPGNIVPLGAVSLGACIIEKHFTDDKTRPGPDHPFAMDGKDFKDMVNGIRTLEKALGSPVKDLYAEESETAFLQRRCLRAARDIRKGTRITKDMMAALRPVSPGALEPKYADTVVGREARCDIKKGEGITWNNV